MKTHLILLFTAVFSLVLLKSPAAHAQRLPPPDALVSPSGYLYVLHHPSSGRKPVAGDFVFFHVRIGHENRQMYDSRREEGRLSIQMPATVPQGDNPAPIEETIGLLSAGDSLTVWVPIEKFKTRPAGFVNVQYYIVDLVLLEIESAGSNAKREQLFRFQEVTNQVKDLVNQYRENKLGERLQETPSGLKYVLLKPGEGPAPVLRQTVWVQYLGMLLTGKVFDDSFRRGEPLRFGVGRGMVISGWELAVKLLRPGGSAVFFIPPALAYGEKGAPPNIPPNAELVFFMELERVK